jgi:hypothetical protein
MLLKMLRMVTGSPQTALAPSKESLHNMLKFIGQNRSNHIPYVILKSFSSVKCVPVQFSFQVIPQIKITNTKIQQSWSPQSCTNDPVIEHLS